MNSPSVESPKPSAQETYLLNQILSQITEQKAYNDMMMPEYAHQLHYKIEDVAGTMPDYTADEQKIVDSLKTAQEKYNYYMKLKEQYPHEDKIWYEANKWKDKVKDLQSQVKVIDEQRQTYADTTSKQWVKMSDEEWYNSEKTTDAERRAWDINTETQERQLKALRGELPLTESLQQQKAKEFEQLKNTYGVSGATVDDATAQDTIGTQNLSEFKKRWNALEEQERYGQLASGTSAMVQSQGLASDIVNRNIGNLSSIGGQNASLTSGYYSLLQPYMSYTQAGYQAQAQNQLTQQQQRASLLGMGAAGASTGAMIGGPYGAAIGGLVGLGAGYFATR